ncbi:MAG: malto-oligosyltrehalose synthase, partial [Actinomycetota bacterium]|nr:malto-oligosyltrehalose synthase [Actinomycetota bacterium]
PSLLATLDAGADPPGPWDGLDAEKLWLTSRVLRLRRDRPELFDAQAGYEPLASASPHLLGFLRAGLVATLVTRWPGSLARQGWRDATVGLPAGLWTDVLTDGRHEVGEAGARCADILAALPLALLVKADA